MNAYELIKKKRDGSELNYEELESFLQAYLNGDIKDYQMSAMLMAMLLKGMSFEEVSNYTKILMKSGDIYDFADLDGPKVDKHSTGGVGDKPSIVLAPLLASVGVYVPMVSGRGLGHTGGTLDKLEAISGFNTQVSYEEFKNILYKVGCVMGGQTQNFVPLDKMLYALRDVTATVDDMNLICGSIMSKKLSEGIDALVLDVKTGSGAFMVAYEDSKALAKLCVTIGNNIGKKVRAIITDMNQPLGSYVGNSCEIFECIKLLRGDEVASDIYDLTMKLAQEMYLLSGKTTSKEEADKVLKEAITSGRALEKFGELIEAHGGNPKVIEDTNLLPDTENRYELKAQRSGYISEIKTNDIGFAGIYLGAGRKTLDTQIDHAVGFKINKKLGDKISAGDTILTIHYNNDSGLGAAINKLNESYIISDKHYEPGKLIKEIVD
ncbi:MAG: thymidine phosphorylase [Pseudomonadota bacterium]